MNREVKITLGVLLCLIGVIVYLEVFEKGEDVPEVEPIEDIQVLDDAPAIEPVRMPEPTPSPVKGDGGGKDGAMDQSFNRPGESSTKVVEESLPEKEAPLDGVAKSLDDNMEIVVEQNKPKAEPTPVRSLPQPEKRDERVAVTPNLPKRYVVKKGDTVSQISEKVMGSVHFLPALLDSNPELIPDQLYVGVELKMPSKASLEALAVELNEKKERRRGEGFYKIQEGDSLYKISKNQLGSTKYVNKIIELNPNVDPRQLRIGQVIRLPEKE